MLCYVLHIVKWKANGVDVRCIGSDEQNQGFKIGYSTHKIKKLSIIFFGFGSGLFGRSSISIEISAHMEYVKS